MKVGDLVRDKLGTVWVIYDFTNVLINPEDNKTVSVACVSDPITQKANEILDLNDIIEVVEKPANVSWLFIKRRDQKLKDIAGLVW